MLLIRAQGVGGERSVFGRICVGNKAYSRPSWEIDTGPHRQCWLAKAFPRHQTELRRMGEKELRSQEHGRGPWHLVNRDMQTRRAYPDEIIVYYALVAFPRLH